MTKNFKVAMCFFVVWFSIFLPTTLIKIDIPCVQCGETTYSENIWCRIATGFNINYMHDYCADEWCEENPIQLGFVVDEEGKKYTLEHYKKLKFREQ